MHDTIRKINRGKYVNKSLQVHEIRLLWIKVKQVGETLLKETKIID